MNERERLIELLMQGELEADKQGFFNCSRSEWKAEIMANFLLKNGVTVLPVKVGDTVYIDNEPHDILAMYNEENCISYIADYNCDERNCMECRFAKEILFGEVTRCEKSEYSEFTVDDIGKTVFLTREEAEKALKEREDNA